MADGRIVIDAKINTAQPVQAVKSLKAQAATIAAEYRKQGMSMSDAMKKAWSEIERTGVAGASKTKSSVSGINLAFKSLGSTVSRLGGLLASVLGPIALIALVKQCIELGSAVNEVQNVVDTAFGSMAYKMEAFAQNSITQFGMSQLAAKKTGSTYMAMAKGMGIAVDEASDMSIALTGLTGDVASFYNISQDEAATKLKSVFTGETESLKDLGVVMTQTNLEQYALSKGITKSISAMTQAEQTTLRYQYVMNALNMASGDFAKTQDSWANQTRILAMQMQQLGANIGSILTTVLTPGVKVLNDIVANLVHATSVISAAIVSLFGGQIQQNTAIAGSASAAADAENELAAGITGAANAAKKAQAGFDELNILQSDTGGGGSGGASGGIGSTSTSSETSYEQGKGLDTAEIERAAEIIKKIADWVPVIAATLGGLKLGRFISDLVTANTKADTLKGTIALLGKKAGITIGVTLAIAGIALEGKGIADAISQGLNGINFAEILGGGLVITGGSALLGKSIASMLSTAFADSAITKALASFGTKMGVEISTASAEALATTTAKAATVGGTALAASIGAIVAGIPMYITGIYDAIVNGLDWLNSALTAAGSTLAGAGIGMLIGGPIGAGIGALVGLAVGAITDLGILIAQNWDAISAWLVEAWATVCESITAAWEWVCALFATVGEWFYTNVIAPVADFFVGLWNGIATAAGACWDGIVGFFTPAVEWFSQLFGSIFQTISDIFYNIGVIASGCWEIIQKVWEIVSEWFDTNVIQPVSSFFSNMWTSIKTFATDCWKGIQAVFKTIGSWIDTNVIKPVTGFFSRMWDGLKNGAVQAWNGIKSAFGSVATWFKDIFSTAWAGVVQVFSVAGEIFVNIKDGILSAFKTVVNGIITGINNVVAVPFNGINSALNAIKNIEIVGIRPFSGLRTINVPQIPYLAQGAVLPPNKPFMAVVGDQKHGTNVEAPLATIQEAVAQVMKDNISAMLAGFEALLQEQQATRQTIAGIKVGDTVIGQAAERYQHRMAMMRGGL